MAYDLLIQNGRIVDGSGAPAFRGDVGIKNGKIAEIGKLSGPAIRTIDAAGQVVMPGLVNTHTHAPMVLYRGLADDLVHPVDRQP